MNEGRENNGGVNAPGVFLVHLRFFSSVFSSHFRFFFSSQQPWNQNITLELCMESALHDFFWSMLDKITFSLRSLFPFFDTAVKNRK